MEELRIIGQNGQQVPDDVYVSDCLVEYAPDLKWRLEKKNAFDASYVHRREPYHDDKIECQALLTPAKTTELSEFILTHEKLWLEFSLGDTVLQLPVTVEKLPKWEDGARFDVNEITFSFSSIYVTLTPIDFSAISGWGVNWGDCWGF